MNRYLAEGDNWEQHFERTRRFIVSCLEKSKAGSGWLLDVPFEFLCDHFKEIYLVDIVHPRQEDKEILRKRIQQQHLDLLRPGHACLISDIEERVLNRDNRIISSKRLLYAELPEDIHREEWTWTFVARGEYNPKHRTEMMVRAIRL